MRFPAFIKNRKQSMRRMLFGYMLTLALVLVVAVFAGAFIFGHISTAYEKIYDTLSLQMEVFKREISSHHENLTMKSLNLSKEASKITDFYFYNEGISFDKLQNSHTHLNNLQDKFLDLLSEEIQKAECSGAFIFLDTTINTRIPNAENSKSGIYIHKNIADATDDTLLLYRGNAQLAKNKGIAPHRKWKLEFDKNIFPDYKKLINTKKDTSIEKAYHTSDIVTLPGTSERVMLVAVPIRGYSGEIYGVCGFEISSETFGLYHSQPSTLEQLVCIFSKIEDGGIDCSKSFSSGITNGYNLSPKGILEIKNFGKNLKTFQNEDSHYIGLTSKISIARGNKAEHMLSVMIPKYSYTGIRNENTLQILLFIILLMFFAISCCGYLSKRYISPILSRMDKLKQNENLCDDAESSYAEIDDLFAFLEDKEKKLIKAQSKAKNLSYLRKSEIDPEEYEYFKDGIKMLTKKERKIFDLYMQGKTAAEILEISNIKERTLKFHNSNIYSKLGVQSKKELLRFAELYDDEINKDLDKLY